MSFKLPIGSYSLIMLAVFAGWLFATTGFCASKSALPKHAELSPIDQVTPADVERLALEVEHPDPEVRRIAQLRVKNLPAAAFETVRDRLDSGDISPEGKIALANSLGMLKARYDAYGRKKLVLNWEKKFAVESYEKFGVHDARWDAAAKTALADLGEVESSDPTELAARIARYRVAIDAGCTDPVVLIGYATRSLERPGDLPAHASGEFAKAARKNLKNAGQANAPAAAAPAVERDTPALAPLMRHAVDAVSKSKYPAYFKCLTLHTASRVMLRTYTSGGDRPDVRRYLGQSLTLLPDAFKTLGCPVDRQMNLLVGQYNLTAAIEQQPARDKAYRQLYSLYSAAAPGTVGPLLFKGETYLTKSRETEKDRGIEYEERAKKVREQLTVAGEAFAGAWKLDPTNPKIAARMIASKRDQENARDEVEQWFDRAMKLDPDNYDACREKMSYLKAHGTPEETLDFARSCLKTQNFRGRVAFLLTDTHLALASETPGLPLYLRRPHVWEDFQETYESFLSVFPGASADRSSYARLACQARQFADANRQFLVLGEKGNVGKFGGRDAYDRARIEAARFAANPELARASAPDASDPALAAVLEEIVFPDGARDTNTALRSVASHFQEIDAGTAPGKPVWNHPTLNTLGKGFDCVRFRTPKGNPRDMRWAFELGPNRLNSWYVFRVDGVQMRGFASYQPGRAVDLPGIPSPGDAGWHEAYVQDLPAAQLVPDTDYLLWFRLNTTDPVPMTIGMTFVPPAGNKPNSDQMFKDMGLKWGAR